MPNPYGGGPRAGAGATPFHVCIAPLELTRACRLISTARCSVEDAFDLSCKFLATRSSINRSRLAGKAALEKQESGAGLDENEASALAFYSAVKKAYSMGTHILARHSLGDERLEIGKEPDTLDDKGKVIIKGKMRYANPRAAPQAMGMLQRRLSFWKPWDEDDEAAATHEPTREDLIADLRTLMQTDPGLLEEAGLQPK